MNNSCIATLYTHQMNKNYDKFIITSYNNMTPPKNEKEAYDMLISLENEVEIIVEQTNPEEIPLLEAVFKIINTNFHVLYDVFFKLFYCECFGEETTRSQ